MVRVHIDNPHNPEKVYIVRVRTGDDPETSKWRDPLSNEEVRSRWFRRLTRDEEANLRKWCEERGLNLLGFGLRIFFDRAPDGWSRTNWFPSAEFCNAPDALAFEKEFGDEITPIGHREFKNVWDYDPKID